MCIFGIAGSIVQASQAKKQAKKAEEARKQVANLQRNNTMKAVNETASELRDQNSKNRTIGSLRIPFDKTTTQLPDGDSSDTSLGLNIPT